jgi:hypothetical protein
MSDITSVVVAVLGGIASLCAGVWWLSRLSVNTQQTRQDVTEIKASTKQISDAMIGFQHIITDHDRRIKQLEEGTYE